MKNKTKNLAFPLKIKAVSENGEISGYGSVFDVIDSYRDRILPGAFSETLEEWDEKGTMPAMLWQHDHRQPIGIWEEMKEDETGLFVKGHLLLNDVQQAKEAYALIKAKALNGLSIGFSHDHGCWNEEMRCYDISKVKLWEVSPVTFPANQAATIENVKSKRDLECFLRDAGLSRREAKAVASSGFAGLNQRDVDCGEFAELIQNCWNIK